MRIILHALQRSSDLVNLCMHVFAYVVNVGDYSSVIELFFFAQPLKTFPRSEKGVRDNNVAGIKWRGFKSEPVQSPVMEKNVKGYAHIRRCF